MKSNQFRVVKKTIYCFHSNIYFLWLLVYLPWLTGILKSPRCDIIDWHYDRGLNNSKLTVWSLITVADGGMRVWHFNRVITTYGKWDCRNSWRYSSLAVNRGAIKRGFTVYWTLCIHYNGLTSFSAIFQLQSNFYIKGTQGNLKMCPLSAVALYIQVKIICTTH